MNFINFESLRDKEAVREELREARSELLIRAEIDAKKRAEKNAEKELRGETKWILPAIAKKLKKSSKTSKKKKKKESKKSKSVKKSKKKKRHQSSSDSDTTDSDDESEPSKLKKKNKKSKKYDSTSSGSSSDESNEWIEKSSKDQEAEKIPAKDSVPLVRDDWMTNGDLFMKTYSKEKKEVKKKSIDEYNPATSVRELNPHWKNNGDGLPSFQKPSDDGEERRQSRGFDNFKDKSFASGGWKKRENFPKAREDPREIEQRSRSNKDNRLISNKDSRSISNKDYRSKKKSDTPSSAEESNDNDDDPDFLTDQQMNELAAKIIKAEILGNDEQLKILKQKLENARQVRSKLKETLKKDELKAKTSKLRNEKKNEEHIVLTVTDNQGNVRPFQGSSYDIQEKDHRGKHKKTVETHDSGKRVRYFPDDERYDLNQMFTRERNIKGIDSDLQFAEIAGKSKNPNDDLEDIFADSIRKNPKDEAKKQAEYAIQQEERLQKILDDCDKCFNTPKMQQNLMVSMGKTVYLSLPWHEGLQPGHCLIIPMQHTTCSTRLDEDVWAEVTEYRKALKRMFENRKQDVIFFETARYLNRSQHMVIHCIPCKGEMAPFYFKKAIQESEQEWSTNKQLISLKDKDLRRSVPKGLPYFWVNFGMHSGFAHVIEDQNRFPENYAQEIIGNMLELDPRTWRKPRKEHNFIQKVKQFADWFKAYDFTNNLS